MDGDMDGLEHLGAPGAQGKPKAKNDNRMSVERIYQKKSQLEHIILRPDSYIGSVQTVTEPMWVHNGENMVQREITYVPGLFKIFDEILVNAADNKQRDKNMDTIKIDINAETNTISVYNNGKGIPVEMHKGENMYVPTMIFGHLLTSSNFSDEDQKTTGGRNGFGAKLCNVFSTKFTVETADKKNTFKQTWTNNMSKKSEPRVKESKDEFTKITFSPDLPKFHMETLDADTVAMFSRRAYDIAASSKGVKVFLNGKRIPVNNFKQYVDQYLKGKEDDTGAQIKCVFESVDRWDVAVAVSDKGFQQMSFVNSIATTKGGRHVDYVADMLVKGIIETVKKKAGKGAVTIKPFQVKNHIWVFVNCLIVNPTFDSQTKENMTLVAKQFGSKLTLSEKFNKELVKSGIVEAVVAWSKFKADMQLKNKSGGKKTNKLKGIPKLEDANEAGTKNSSGCTLILTEGDSAKTLAVAGLGVVGRDYYGVYPLKGKLLNVREATHKQILENKEICELVKIMGLTYKKKYETMEDIKGLRYGKLMIMTDQDQDGSHIKGLVINFIHHNWPSLLKLPFMEQFITPIVKATKGANSISFYSLPEFVEWKGVTDNWHTYKIKYYKGLGTSTSKEAKEYFADMIRHKIKFQYDGDQDGHAIAMAFAKKHIDLRKEWLTSWMEENKRRRELDLPEVYLYEKDTRAVNYSNFINKELVLFSNLDNERSIPCLVDGFKPGQRKVMFTCLKKNMEKKEVKVAQLAGSVGEMSAYHHGEMSLMGTIVGLAQDYVGSNNINLLKPIGQFGTRLTGGKDSASPRYIFTQLSALTRHIFNPKDDPLLNYLKDDNLKIEPEWYIPIIPMILVNGASGIGTGWATNLPNFNPREIVKNLKHMLAGEPIQDMVPWFKNFKGTIEPLDHQRYVVNGEISTLSDTKVEITELPIRTWTNAYKETLEGFLTGNEKIPACITDYKDYNTDKTVKFVVEMSANKLREVEQTKGLHTFFKLQTTMAITSMVLFDHLGCLKKYENVDTIFREFFDLRLKYYGKRKKHMEGMLTAEASRLSNQARFILEKCDGTVKVENKKKKVMIAELTRRGYDSDPVKAWNKSQLSATDLDESANEASDNEEEANEENGSGPDYDYLVGMPMWNLTEEKKNAILKQRDDKQIELRTLQGTTKEQLWHADLDAFLEKLDEVEEQERADDAGSNNKQKVDKSKKGKGAAKGRTMKQEALPSPMGIRVVPRVADELKLKYAKIAVAADKKKNKVEKKPKKEVKDEKDEFDMMTEDAEANKSLTKKLGTPGKAPKLKQTKLAFKQASPTLKKKNGRNPWSDDSEDASGSDAMDSPVAPRERVGGRATAAKKTYNFDDDSSSTNVDSDSGEEDMFDNDDNEAEKPAKPAAKKVFSESESDGGSPAPPPAKKQGSVLQPKKNVAEKPKAKPPTKTIAIDSDSDGENERPNSNAANRDEFDVSDSGSDFGGSLASKLAAPKQKAARKNPPKKLGPIADNIFEKAKKAAPKKPAAKKAKADSDDEDDMFEEKPKKKPSVKKTAKKPADSDDSDFDQPKAKKSKKPAAKKNVMDSSDGSDMSFDASDVGPARDRPGRAKAPVSYGGMIDSDDSD